jgi:hypothetical protein
MRATALNDESGNVTVELQAIVIAGLRKLAEVCDVARRAGAVEGHTDNALAGSEDRDLVALHLVRGLIQWIRKKAHAVQLL